MLKAENCRRDVCVADGDGRIVGHISHRRLAEYVFAEHRPSHTRRQLMERVAGGVVSEFMDTSFASASPEEELDDVLHRQLEQEIEDMPVVDGNANTLGAIYLTSVLRELMRAGGEAEEAQ